MTTSNNSLFKQIGIKKFIPGIAWFFLVLTLCCIPGDDLPKVDNWMIQIDYDKLIHVGIFAVLAFLFMYPIVKSALSKKEKWHYCIKLALVTMVWGYTTEVIQKFFIPGRSYDLADWLSDSIGGLVALIFCKLYFLRTPKTRT
jgi:VanZ family protein